MSITAEAKDKIERDRRFAEAARRKAAEEKQRRKNVLQVVRTAEDTSGKIRRVTTGLNEIVRKSIETQEALLQQTW